MRGEDEAATQSRRDIRGSPPHARGRPPLIQNVPKNTRITPACAGKTDNKHVSLRQARDHPRMRGEDQVYRAIKQGEGRITPACAGKTCPKCVFRAIMGDHPRMRGEDLCGYYVAVHCGGSPPHARGRPVVVGLAGQGAGITPACAGKTEALHRPGSRLRDHPRMRGEDLYLCGGFEHFGGSPPHARGRPVSLWWI